MKQVIILFAFCIYFLSTSLSYAQETLVNSDRLHQHLMHLSNYGKNEDGGSDRVGFSSHDLAAREYIISLMKEAGLEVKIDAAANIIGKRAGKNPELKPIAFGSHIDEVPNGGHYDGPVGSLSAIEVIQTLQEQTIETQHPLEVIIFANEEGGVVGSRAMVGQLNEEALKVVSNAGISQAEGISRLGGDPTKIPEMAREKGDLAAFIELHIEQGANLYNEKIDIGVVEGIVAIEWWEFTFKGKANHAGTTPMNLRKDPMLPAAKFILAVNETVRAEEGRQVGTVGKIQAYPGAGNVIPGEVKLSLEIRDLSAEKIWSLYEQLENQAKKFAEEYGVEVSVKHIEVASKPAIADESIRKIIKESADQLGLTAMSLPSGAGHDAQEIARIAPMGMIFIPSKDGISHAPDEYSSKEEIANGANVLLKTILALDKKLN